MQILFIDRDRLLLYDGERFETATAKASKDHFCAASVSMRDLIVHTLRLPSDLSQEQLQVEVELKMYEEGQLDPNSEYRIDFVRLPVEQETIVEVFAYEKGQFEEQFGELAQQLSAIDLLFPSSLAFAAYYQKLADPKSDLIVHIGKEESYALFYKEGRYIGHRLLDSLETIAKKSGIEEAKLEELLRTKGLVRERYDLQETHIIDQLEQIFMQNIEKIAYSINQKRSLFGYSTIDRILVDFEGAGIEGIERFFEAFGVEYGVLEALNYRQKAKESFLYLRADYALAIASGEDLVKVDLSFLERKPPLWRYESVRLALMTFVLIALLGGGYFGAQYYLDKQRQEIAILKERLVKRKQILKRYFKKIKALQKERDALRTRKEELHQEVQTAQLTLDAMPMIMKSKLARQRFVNDVVAALAKFGLKSERIEQQGTKWVEVLLVSKSMDRDRIAKFFEELLAKGYKKVATQRIWYEEEYYKSLVRIER